MWGRVKLASCLAGLLLVTPSFGQNRASRPQAQPHPKAQNADGQWHHFQKQKSPAASHANPARPPVSRAPQNRPPQNRPPQNQPGHSGNWLRRYKDLPPAQQRRALENDPQFRKLPPPQQARLQQRLQHFSSLPRDQQERMLNRMETWEHLTSDQKQRARQLFQQFKLLPADRRQTVNEAIRGMRDLTPAQRDQLINSEQYRNDFSLQERVLLEGAAHLPLAPGDGLQTAPPE
ncbi:MAG: DUF3106 domain-containing protein [Terriglobales bacterium]